MTHSSLRRCSRSTHEIGHDGELLVLDPSGEKVLVLNAVGAAVFELCDGARTREDIAALVSETLGVDPLVTRSDVDRFVTELLSLGLVVECPT